jgi:hypothetical protein
MQRRDALSAVLEGAGAWGPAVRRNTWVFPWCGTHGDFRVHSLHALLILVARFELRIEFEPEVNFSAQFCFSASI